MALSASVHGFAGKWRRRESSLAIWPRGRPVPGWTITLGCPPGPARRQQGRGPGGIHRRTGFQRAGYGCGHIRMVCTRRPCVTKSYYRLRIGLIREYPSRHRADGLIIWLFSSADAGVVEFPGRSLPAVSPSGWPRPGRCWTAHVPDQSLHVVDRPTRSVSSVKAAPATGSCDI